MIHALYNYGFVHTICDPSFVKYNKVSAFWAYVFALSKVPELGDTIFVVLRKKPLIFLHYYHHVTVLIYCWFVYWQTPSISRWFTPMNFAVHSVMYAYYAAQAFGFRIPRAYAMLITISQITQMFFGLLTAFVALRLKETGQTCENTRETLVFGLLMYGSYLILFFHFFISVYFSGKQLKTRSGNLKKHE
ncbi:elongation of very long chain fatty acids protein 6-like protein [Dinothrombium tinctorium]|uniref:Elongation of very long chain fatty acids protein n=1 Tax=Dinothrombium tinctorium TaxID=1965070 RepID=A0A443Q5R3_9ACAR|nr:elongation of very long chain fatty acids protein 6-like protein [Dinothrombium tinctorium]